MSNITYVDIDGTRKPTTWNAVFEAVGRIRNYFEALQKQFFERDEVIHKLMLAMMMREHILLIGPTGTAKSALFNRAFGGITGSEQWSMDLTKFTGDTHLFGSYDQREMEKTGHMRHMTEGSVAEANFAHFGEFFDASDPTLRTLLGAINECRVKRGPQVMRIPLLTAVADTNFRPEDQPARAKQLAAVVDRFLFKVELQNDLGERNDFLMHEAYLAGDLQKPLPPLHVRDVILVSEVVVGHEPNIFSNKYVLEAYVELKRGVSAERAAAGRPPISPRRSLKASQLVEVSALLNGRKKATFNDLWEVQSVLVAAFEDAEILQRSTESAVKKWAAKEARHSIETELAEVRKITDEIPTQLNFPGMKTSEIVALKKVLNEVIEKLGNFENDSLEGGLACQKGQEECHKLLVESDKALLRIVERALPEQPQDTPMEALHKASEQLQKIGKILDSVNLGDRDVITTHSRLTQRVALAQEIFLRKLADRELEDLLQQWTGK